MDEGGSTGDLCAQVRSAQQLAWGGELGGECGPESRSEMGREAWAGVWQTFGPALAPHAHPSPFYLFHLWQNKGAMWGWGRQRRGKAKHCKFG